MFARHHRPLTACAAVVLALSQCRDPQNAALKQLTTRGYSLSVAQFFKAASKGDAEALRLFVAAGVAPDVKDERDRQAVHAAAEAGQIESIKVLTSLGATLPTTGERACTILASAVRSHSVPTLRFLVDHGVKPDAKITPSPFAIAAVEGQREMLELLLPLCLGQQDAALLAAAEKGDVTVLSTLLRMGASVFAREPKTRQTPLMKLAANGHQQAIAMMLSDGANRWAVDAEGFIAGEHAQAALHADVAKQLLSDASPGETSSALPIKDRSLPVRLNTLDTQLVFTGKREALLPFMLQSITDTHATITMGSDRRLADLAIGEVIPDTKWTLDRIKLGGAIFRYGDTSERVMLMPGTPSRYGDLVAVINDESAMQSYEATEGDTFSSDESPAHHFIVKQITPLHIIIADTNTPPRMWTLKLGGKRWGDN